MDNDNDVVRLAAREIAVLDAEIKELTERRDALKSHFKDANTYTPGEYDYGDVVVKVTTNQRISEKKAKENLDLVTLNQISTMKVDAKKARAYLSATPKVLDRIMDHYDHKIEVKLKETPGW